MVGDTNKRKGKEGNHHRKDAQDMEWKNGDKERKQKRRSSGEVKSLDK